MHWTLSIRIDSGVFGVEKAPSQGRSLQKQQDSVVSLFRSKTDKESSLNESNLKSFVFKSRSLHTNEPTICNQISNVDWHRQSI